MLLKETFRMTDFNHPNVLKLIGITFIDNKIYVILPFMKNKDLHTFIKGTEASITMDQ